MARTAVRVLTLMLAAAAASASDSPPGVETDLQRLADTAATPAYQQAATALWGRPLAAPVLLHDRATGTTWQRDTTTGTPRAASLRKDQPPANTCIQHEGTPTVLLLRPLPATPAALATLYWHEQWHCVQAALGLPATEGDTAHLDGEAGRLWLRMEMRALASALSTEAAVAKQQHVAAALSFRAQRAGLAVEGTQALAEEAKLERNEGLAEYTGRWIAAAAGPRPDAAVVAALGKAEQADGFVRSAAYVTGSAYGLLLDHYVPSWRGQLSAASDLPAMLAGALPAARAVADAEQAGAGYGLQAVRAEEAQRAAERARRSAAYRVQFLGDQALRMPLRTPSVSFDPRALFPLDDAGTVYRPITVRDGWGELTAEGGALLAKDWSQVRVQGGAITGCGQHWQGPGWSLQLAEGWQLQQQDSGWALREGEPVPCNP